MKKDGFILIEVIISIFMLIILLGVGISIGQFGKNLKSDISDIANVYEIQNLLSYGKAVCKEKNKYGKVTVTARENKISFIEGWDKIEKTTYLPKDIKIISKDISVLITSEGKISKGNTISLLDKYGKRQDITIGVGVDYISIKEGKYV